MRLGTENKCINEGTNKVKEIEMHIQLANLLRLVGCIFWVDTHHVHILLWLICWVFQDVSLHYHTREREREREREDCLHLVEVLKKTLDIVSPTGMTQEEV